MANANEARRAEYTATPELGQRNRISAVRPGACPLARAVVADAVRDVPPHITLLGPWRPAPVAPDDIVAVSEALARIEPFRLTFRSVERFESHGVLYLRPEPDGLVREMIRRLVRAFPETPPYGGTVADPVPRGGACQ